MQEAFHGSWAREAHFTAEILGSLRDLNHRFLDLTGARSGDWGAAGGVGAAAALGRHVAPLSPAQRAVAANCPYALFDLRFQDDGHWRLRLQNTGR